MIRYCPPSGSWSYPAPGHRRNTRPRLRQESAASPRPASTSLGTMAPCVNSSLLLFEGAFPFCGGPNSRASSLETAPTAAGAPRIERARCLPNRRRAIAFCNVAANIGIQLNDGDKPKYFLDLFCQKLGRSVSGLAPNSAITLSLAPGRYASLL